MKTIQCLTVVVMMTVMVYTASLPKDELLKDIHDAALNMSKINTTLDLYVTKIGPDGGPTCVRNFFCLAEKSLETATKEHHLHGERLIRLLKRFNNETGITHCQLNTTNEHKLKKFLENIMMCVHRWKIIHNHQ
ncbi:uncharacterized protein LOC144463794 [Epinephelus lanceolatus]